jgi:transposase-like protein
MAKYKKEIVDRIYELLSTDTYTIAEVCQIVGITEETFHKWKREKTEFSECIRRAEAARNDFFVSEAKKSLLKKIQGYTVTEKHVTYVNSREKSKTGEEKDKPKVKEQKVIEKFFQPDTSAIVFTLTNRDPDNWKNKQSNELTGKDGKELAFPPIKVEVIDSRTQVRADEDNPDD